MTQPSGTNDPWLITDQLSAPLGDAANQTDYSAAGESASDLEYAISELDAHAPSVLAARMYAEGRSPEIFFVSDAAQREVATFIDYFGLNFAGLVIDTVADRMIVNAIDGIDNTEVEEIVFQDNKFYTWSSEAIYRMLTDGDHYVISLPGDDESSPVMVTGDAVDTRIFYDDETQRTPEFGIRRWAIGRGKDRLIRANLWYPDHVERFVRPAGQGNDGAWRRWTDGDLPDSEPIEFLPFAHLRTRAPYGRPIHERAYGPQDMIVKGVMTLMSSTESSGWSQRYALHDESLIGQTGLPGQPATLPDGTTQKPRLRGGPGTMWDLYAKAVGVFPPADLEKLIKVLDFAVRAMSQVTRTPMHYFDPAGGWPSGESLIAGDQPIRASANRQRGNAGQGFAESVEQIGRYAGLELEPQTVWAPDPVISDAVWWTTAGLKRDNGVPQSQILLEAGYTPEQVEEFEAENKRMAAEFQTPVNPTDTPDPSNENVDPADPPTNEE